MLLDYVLLGVSACVLIFVYVLIALEYVETLRSRSEAEVVAKAGGRTPSWHPERYYRQHPERKMSRPTPEPEISMPDRTSLTTDRVLTILLGVSSLIFPLG